MLHADRFEGTLQRHLHAIPDLDSSAKSSVQAQVPASLSALNALLATEVSPSKRAVIETLIKLWEANPRAYLQQTG